ncbi:glycerate kinase [Gemella sanguinis]|uniref:glycerate kinase n=1 Tax=Gemella sanguinis TaxID=84135 RepID=UPI0004E20989|nr:glycerate kinase [Gemella sanguinis]NKZ25832.1 glycerate kinase [Gemella sanguinis]
MKILVAVNEFKGSLTSREIADLISKLANSRYKNIEIVPEVIADGGDGFLDIFNNFSKKEVLVTNAMGEKIKASYLVDYNNKKAVIEVAEIIGLKKVSEKNPYLASTYGLGEVIKSLLQENIRDFIIGLGGSATNDCGIGMLSALGYKFYDKNNNECIHGINALSKINRIDDSYLNENLKNAKFTLISDVENILCGQEGATYVFSKQKGLKEENFQIVDDYVNKFTRIVYNKYNTNYSNILGSGAAGGLAYGFLTFTNSEIKKGSDFMIEYLEIEEKIKEIDIVITGEGKLDLQSFMGKAPIEIARVAKKYKKNVIFLAGTIVDKEIDTLDTNTKSIIDASFSILRGISTLDEAMNKKIAISNLENTVSQVFNLLEIFKNE